MLLHLIQDNIFVDAAIEVFEIVVPNQNIYLLNVDKHSNKINHIKNISRIRYAHCGTKEFWSFFDKTKIKAVIIHGMTEQASKSIHKFSKDIHFHWMCMGYDLYGTYAELNSSLFQPETEQYFREYDLNNRSNLTSFKKYVKEIIYKVTGTTVGSMHSLQLAMNKIKSCSMVIDDDFNLFKTITGTKAKHLSFNYGYLENVVPMNTELHNNGRHILLGNSSSWTNNHLDAFQILKGMSLNEMGVKVYTPLSYGDESYRELIIRKGKNILGDSFIPITDFLPMNEYTEILKKCSVAIMNHNRQQAMGNIIILIWLGMRLYLKESNPVCHFLKRIGISFSDLDRDFNLTNPQALQPLCDTEILANRKALITHYEKDVVLQRTKYLCEYLLKATPPPRLRKARKMHGLDP